MRVDELIRGAPLTVPAAEALVGCARRMLDHGVRHLPVLGPDGEVLGVATDDGVFAHGALVDDGHGWVWFDGADPSVTARDVASPVDVSAAPGDDLGATLRRLGRSPRDFVVVRDADGLVGLLTEHDLLRAAIGLVPASSPLPASSPVATVTPSTPADRALRLQRDLGFRHLVVVGDDGAAVGVVSRRDLLTAWPRTAPVADLLPSTPLVAVTEGRTVGDVLGPMRDLHLGCVPVVDAAMRPVGIVTRRDLLGLVVSGLADADLFPSESSEG